MKQRILLMVETSRGYGRGIVEGVARYAHEHNEWSIFFEDSGLDGFQILDDLMLRKGNWNGIIVRSPTLEIAQQIHKTGIPSVELLTSLSRDDVFPDVITDYVKVSRLAADHLMECELKHFAYFSMVDTSWSNFRRQEFCQALEDSGYSCNIFPVEQSRVNSYPHSLKSWDIGFQDRLIQWLKKLPKPVGLFVATDSYAIYVLQACLIADIPIPNEIAVLSCDNDLLICRTVFPPLSSIDHNTCAVGYQAATLLDRRMRGEPCPRKTIFVPPGIVAKRQSTNLIAVEDEDLAMALAFIHSHIAKPISITHVANAVCVTRKTLERRFKEILGRTPREEIFRFRMDKAKMLLRETLLPAETIAGQVGYPSVDYFFRVFKKVFKVTPSQYRQSLHFSDSFGGELTEKSN